MSGKRYQTDGRMSKSSCGVKPAFSFQYSEYMIGVSSRVIFQCWAEALWYHTYASSAMHHDADWPIWT